MQCVKATFFPFYAKVGRVPFVLLVWPRNSSDVQAGIGVGIESFFLYSFILSVLMA